MIKLVLEDNRLTSSIFIGIILIISIIAIQSSFISQNSYENTNTKNNTIAKQDVNNLLHKNPQLNPSKNSKALNENLNIPFTGFIENQGQNTNNDIRYYFTSESSGIAFTESKILFHQKINENNRDQLNLNQLVLPSSQEYYTFSISFPGSNNVKPVGVLKTSHTTNYFTNGLKLTNVESYKEVWYYNLYPHIDLRYYMSEKGLKYEFIVNPGGNPKDIIIQSSNNVKLDISNNRVSYYLKNNETDPLVIDDGLKVYKEDGTLIPSQFINKKGINNAYGLEFNPLDLIKLKNENLKLIIDPYWLYFSTYFGGTSDDYGRDIAVDNSGNVYITGSTKSSSGFPLQNAYDNTYGGSTYDAYIAKLTSSGSLIFSTYIGGNGVDVGDGITVDSSGNAYITGQTTSTSGFPLVNSYDSSISGQDAFVLKLSSSGSSIAFSTFIGGAGSDTGSAIAIDSSRNVYIGGYTSSDNVTFPLVNSYDRSLSGSTDAFALKLSSSGGSISYSTYLGGTGSEYIHGITVDSSGNAYLVGHTTSSTGFPLSNSFDNSFGGGSSDGFVLKLTSSGGLSYSSYIGGTGNDVAEGVAVDSSGNVYVTGTTASSSLFPITNPYDGSYNGGTNDAFILKLKYTGNLVLYCTYIGGTGDDQAWDIGIDGSGDAFITGQTSSGSGSGFPLINSYSNSYGGGTYDAFVVCLNSAGSNLVYSTYLGGSSEEISYGIAVDSTGNAYITGQTTSGTGFPLISAYQNSFGGGTYDGFITKLSYESDSTPPSVSISSPTSNSIVSTTTLTYSVVEKNIKSTIVYLDSVANASARPSGYTFSSISNGQHNITIYVTDYVGNTDTKTVLFTVDKINPVVSILSPKSDSYSSFVTFLYSVSDANLASTTIFLDSAPNGSIIPSGKQYNSLSDGQHNLTIKSTDLAGNKASSTVIFYIDNTNPVVSFINPILYSKNNYIKLNYTVSDLNLKNITIYFDGIKNSTSENPGFIFNSLQEGKHNITIIAEDLAGNKGNITILTTIDLTLPSIILNSTSSSNDSFLNTYPELNFNITDQNLDQVWYNWNNDQNTTINGIYSIQVGSFTDGVYILNVYCNDSAGNINKKSFVFTIDKTPPSLNSIQINSNIPVTNLLSVNQSTVFTNTTLYLSVNDINFDNITYNWNNGVKSSLTNLNLLNIKIPKQDGSQILYLTLYDKAGNLEKFSFDFIVVPVTSTSKITVPDNNLIPGGNYNFSFSITNSDQFTVTYTIYIISSSGDIISSGNDTSITINAGQTKQISFVLQPEHASIHSLNVEIYDGQNLVTQTAVQFDVNPAGSLSNTPSTSFSTSSTSKISSINTNSIPITTIVEALAVIVSAFIVLFGFTRILKREKKEENKKTTKKRKHIGAVELIKMYKAPDYTTALEIQRSGYLNYDEYLDAQNIGVSSREEYLAMKFGDFPDYMTFLQAKSEGIEKYDQYKLKLDRVDKLQQLFSRADSISVESFMKYMQFEDEATFLSWMTQLPKDGPINLDGNTIVFKKAQADDAQLLESIDALLTSYSSSQGKKEMPITTETLKHVEDFLKAIESGQQYSLDQLSDGLHLSKKNLKEIIFLVLESNKSIGTYLDETETFIRN